MKTRNISRCSQLMAAALLLTPMFAACSLDSEEDAVASADDRIPLNVTLQVENGQEVQAVTRNATADDQNTQFKKDKKIDVYIIDQTASSAASFTTYTTKRTATANGSGGATFDAGTQYWPASGNAINVYAWYPSGWAGDINTAGNFTAAKTFTVQADQSTDLNYEASDLMFGIPTTKQASATSVSVNTSSGNPVNRKTGQTSYTVPLVFTHRLSRIKVVLTNGAGVTAENLKQATVTLHNVNLTTASISTDNLKTGTVNPSGTANSSITVLKGVDNTTGYAVIPPQTIQKNQEFIRVQLDGATTTNYYVYKPTADLTTLSATEYTYNIKVTSNELKVTTSITPWDPKTGDTQSIYPN